jgi:hypothetical protein
MASHVTELTLNHHLALEIAKHPEQTYFATLMESQPQFSASNLLADLHSETEYWMALLSDLDGKTFLETLQGARNAFDALKHEKEILKALEKALDAHGKGDWEEASKLYNRTLSEMWFAISDWNSAIQETADESPLDHYYPSQAERRKQDIEEPPRSSDEELRGIAPHLFHIYRNLDRLFCIGQEIAGRQRVCLTNYMQARQERKNREA